MRIVLIGERSDLGAELAEHLHLDHVHSPEEITADDFVLDGAPRDIAEARELDALLRRRGAEVDAVLVLAAGDEDVIDHYLGRVIELNPDELFESALDGLREAILAG